jgi:hypothetical protein
MQTQSNFIGNGSCTSRDTSEDDTWTNLSPNVVYQLTFALGGFGKGIRFTEKSVFSDRFYDQSASRNGTQLIASNTKLHIGNAYKNPSQNYLFSGEVYLVAAYSKYLSDSEITQNYNAGLPNSLPVVSNTNFVLLEDVKGNVTITSSDFDNTDLNKGQVITLKVTLLPSTGTVSHINGSGIEEIVTKLPYTLVSNTVMYVNKPFTYGNYLIGITVTFSLC